MVSLSRSFNTNVGGATFFSESTNMEDREYLQPILESFGIFKPILTIPAFSIHLLFSVALAIAGIVLASVGPNEDTKCREYFILLYCHVGLWFLTLIVDLIARIRHHGLRLNGYLEFYNNTRMHHRLPFYIVSLWTATLLMIEALMQHFYPENFIKKCLRGGLTSPMGYVSAIIALEAILIAIVNINYIKLVRRFNKQKLPPDVQREEWNACSNPEVLAQEEIGYRSPGDKVYDFMEKQADLIRHLREHNARLGEKLMMLNAQMQARSRPATSP